jgi:hypothetical protein
MFDCMFDCLLSADLNHWMIFPQMILAQMSLPHDENRAGDLLVVQTTNTVERMDLRAGDLLVVQTTNTVERMDLRAGDLLQETGDGYGYSIFDQPSFGYPSLEERIFSISMFSKPCDICVYIESII